MSQGSNNLAVANKGRASLPMFFFLRFCEALVGVVFITSLPIWLPITWIVLMWLSNTLGQIIFWRIDKSRLSLAKQLWIGRSIFWLTSAVAGTSAYFLYVPGDLAYCAMLNVSLVVIAAIGILQFSGDYLRGTIGACLVILPASLRHLFQSDIVFVLMGIGGFAVCVMFFWLGKKLYQMLQEQLLLRHKAEVALDLLAQESIAQARFFAAVSHDLRQPVHAIGLYLAPLLEKIQDDDLRSPLLGVAEGWRALDDLLSQVLDIARVEANTLQVQLASVELKPLLQRVVLQHNAAAEAKYIRLIILARSDIFMSADTLMLKRALSNMLDNAIKFSDIGSNIVIAVRPKGNCWEVQVRDSGVGIAKGQQKTVFQEFSQVSNAQRDRKAGVGLGLAIVKRFVELMGGEVWLRSALNQGTTVSIKLPRSDLIKQDLALNKANGNDEARRELSHISVIPELKSLPKPILIVEDDTLVSQALKSLFKMHGVSAIFVSNGIDALKVSNQISMAVCDMRLPGELDGLDIITKLQHQNIAGILMTAETSPDIVKRSEELGVDMLIKPIQPQSLFDALAAYTDKTL